jgi:hypothetical protein
MELTLSTFQLKKRQKQKCKAAPRYGGHNVPVAMTSPKISKMSQQSKKEPPEVNGV